MHVAGVRSGMTAGQIATHSQSHYSSFDETGNWNEPIVSYEFESGAPLTEQTVQPPPEVGFKGPPTWSTRHSAGVCSGRMELVRIAILPTYMFLCCGNYLWIQPMFSTENNNSV